MMICSNIEWGRPGKMLAFTLQNGKIFLQHRRMSHSPLLIFLHFSLSQEANFPQNHIQMLPELSIFIWAWKDAPLYAPFSLCKLCMIYLSEYSYHISPQIHTQVVWSLWKSWESLKMAVNDDCHSLPYCSHHISAKTITDKCFGASENLGNSCRQTWKEDEMVRLCKGSHGGDINVFPQSTSTSYSIYMIKLHSYSLCG